MTQAKPVNYSASSYVGVEYGQERYSGKFSAAAGAATPLDGKNSVWTRTLVSELVGRSFAFSIFNSTGLAFR